MKVHDLRPILCFGVASLAACSGGGTSPGPSPMGVVTPTPIPVSTNGPGTTPTATPVGTSPTATPASKSAPTATPAGVSPTATPPMNATPSSDNPTATPVPTATPNTSTLSQAGQQAAAQGALSALAPLLGAAQLASGLSSLSVARRSTGVQLATRDVAPSCNNGVSTSSSQSGNTTNFTVENFYDSACTELWQKIVGQEAAASSSGAGGSDSTLTAGETVYGTNGVQTAYDAINGVLSSSSSGDTSAIQVQTGPSMGNYTGQLGADCSTTSSGSTQNATCSYGSLGPTSGGNALGTVTSLTSTTTQTSGGSNESASGSLALFNGTASAMSLNNNGATVSIAGYTTSQSLGLTETVVMTSGSPTVQTLVITDTPDNVKTTVVVDGFSINGKVVNATSGATEVQFTVDINGNGSITFSDGSSATITNFSIA